MTTKNFCRKFFCVVEIVFENFFGSVFMDKENVKIFEVRGEFKMSEDDSFKTAKNIALESAEKNLDAKVINLDSHDSKAYYNRGICYRVLEQDDLAEKDFIKARELGYNG